MEDDDNSTDDGWIHMQTQWSDSEGESDFSGSTDENNGNNDRSSSGSKKSGNTHPTASASANDNENTRPKITNTTEQQQQQSPSAPPGSDVPPPLINASLGEIMASIRQSDSINEHTKNLLTIILSNDEYHSRRSNELTVFLSQLNRIADTIDALKIETRDPIRRNNDAATTTAATATENMRSFLQRINYIANGFRVYFPALYDLIMVPFADTNNSAINDNKRYVEYFYAFLIAVREQQVLKSHRYQCLLFFELFNSPAYKLTNPNPKPTDELQRGGKREFSAFVSSLASDKQDFCAYSDFVKMLKRRRSPMTKRVVDGKYVSDVKRVMVESQDILRRKQNREKNNADSNFERLFDKLISVPDEPDEPKFLLRAYTDIADPTQMQLCQFVKSELKTTIDDMIKCSLLSDLYTFNTHRAKQTGVETEYTKLPSFFTFTV